VSGHHAEIRRARNAYFIHDLGSTNGTFLNGQRIESEQPLRPGDEVRFGAARFAMVAGAKRRSSVAKILGSALGLILIAGIGFLSFQFVINWENLEKLASSAPQPAASVAANATSAAAPSSAASSIVASPANTEEPATTASTPAAVSSKASSKDEFEAALRRAYASLSKSESVGRSEYEAAAKRQEAADAASNARTQSILARNRENQRRGESAFIIGPGAPAPAGPQQWLTELNRDRAAVDLPPVSEDPTFSDGDLKHAKYVATNYPTRPALTALPSTEDATKPGYTPEGAEAAAHSEVVPFWYPPKGPAPASTSALLFLNSWLAGPFRRAELLSPELHKVGFGEFCLDHACAAALNVSEVVKAAPTPVTFSKPILFPPERYPIALVDLLNEFPNPVSSCSGYAMPVGLPITIQLGRDLDAKLSGYSIQQASKPIEACGFDAMGYSSANAAEQERARKWLRSFGEVVIVPRKPLTRGAAYSVSATVNGQPFSWSFTVSK
jgi:hypothetical protein